MTENPCKDIKTDKLCTMGVGGTRLHITGTTAEIEMLMTALGEYQAKGTRRTAQIYPNTFEEK